MLHSPFESRPTMTAAASDAITFRAARPDDALCLGVLSTQVFLDTYAKQGIRRAVANEVLALHSVAAYEALLADAGVTILVAECAGHLIGFSQVRDGAGDPQVPAAAASELRRLYVQEPFTGRGVGRDLLRQAEKSAAARGAEMLWLTAWEGNKRALQFYPRCGYEDLGATVYTIEGEDYPNRVFGKRVRHVAMAAAQ
jgi:diamine N-acetyltransferase